MGIANIGIVYPKMVGDTIVSQLYECPEFIRDLACVEKTRLIRKEYFAIFCKSSGRRAVRKCSAGVRVRNLHHHADGRNGIQRESLMRVNVDSGDLFDIVEHVTI